MLGYMNEEALRRTVESGLVTFWSRSRQSIWQKGETSGNLLRLVELRQDCDGDALLVLAEPAGPTCHTGEPSCFFETLGDASRTETSGEAAAILFDTIKQRQASADSEGSYVAKLIGQGVDRIGKKVGEEATEVVIAAKNADKAELAHEIADLWFHTFVLLAQQGMTPEDVWDELRGRRRH